MAQYKIITVDQHGWITSAQDKHLNDPTAYASDEAQFGILAPPDNPIRLAPSAQPPTHIVDEVEVPYAWTDCKVVDFAVVPMSEADLAERTAEQGAAEAARIAALIPTYGAQVGQFAALLGVFGLAMPITESEAAAAMYAGVKADVQRTADSQMTMLIYNELRQSLSNDDIYAIGKAIGVSE